MPHMAERTSPQRAPKRPRRSPSAETEQRIIGLLREGDAPLDTATIAARLNRHPNGTRVQLNRLLGRGLVERDHAREGIGRPRELWRLAPRAIAEADRPHTGWAVARSLARAIPATPARLREVEDAGAELGSELVAQVTQLAGDAPLDKLDHALEALGFDPERSDDGAVVHYRLMTCPYAEAVRENPAVVCTLHKGIIRGVLADVAPGARLSAFEPQNPDTAGCPLAITMAKARKETR